MIYDVPLFKMSVALLFPKKVMVPLNVNVWPDVEVAVKFTAAVPDAISCVVLLMDRFVDFMVRLLVKVYCLFILEVVAP